MGVGGNPNYRGAKIKMTSDTSSEIMQTQSIVEYLLLRGTTPT